MSDSVKIRIDGDTKGYEKALHSIESATKKTIRGIAKGTGVIAATFATVSVASLKFAGELEQNLGGSEAVFKEYASSIQSTAEKAFKNMGLSTSDYLATANKMGALFKGAGFEMEEAADITQKAMQRAADVASIMGIDVSMAMESVAGAAKGNFTMMDNLGVAMNDTTLNAYALEKGLGKTTAQMTTQEKVALAMEMFLDRTAYATGNYAKENETLAGALTTAKAALKNFMSGTGEIDDVVESLLNAGKVIEKNLIEIVPKLASGIGELAKGIMGELVTAIADNAPMVLDAIVEAIETLVTSIESNDDKIANAAFVVAQALIQGFLDIIPQVISVAGQIIAEFARELSNAYPLLSPLTGIVRLLANNLQHLAVGVLTVVAAFKVLSIINSVITWMQTAKKAVTAYTTALNAMRTGQALTTAQTATLKSGLSASQIVFGLLTGQIKLADIATKQWATSTAVATAGISVLVGLLAMAASGISDFGSTADDATESVESLAQAQMAEANEAVYLKERLFELEEQMQSGTLSEEEAAEAKNELYIVSKRLDEIIPSVTSKIYDETGALSVQRAEIENLVGAYYKLSYTKSLINAYQGKLDNAAQKIVDADDKLSEIEGYSQFEYFARTALFGDPLEDAWAEYSDAKTEWDGYFEVLQELKTEYSELEDSFKEMTETAEESGNEAGKQVAKTAAGVTDSVKQELGEQETAIETALKNELEYLEKQHKLGIITDKEYYDRLGNIRDKYFKESSEDWQEYTDDIEDYYDSVFKDIQAKMDKFEQGLIDKTNKTYATITLNAGGETKTWNTLADMDTQNGQLKDYLSLLEQLKEKRGEIPKEAISDLSEMNVEDAITFLETMLNASDAQWDNWVAGIEENKALAKELSKEIYADEIEVNQELIQKLIDEWGAVPEDFFKIGEDCAAKYGEGFENAIVGIGAQLKNTVANIFSTIPASVNLQVATVGGYGNSTTYADNRITNITASSSSPRAIIEAQKQAEIYQAHTSKFGG